MTMTDFIPIRRAARRLGVHENTIRNWIDKGLILARRLPSGTRQIPAGEVDRLEREMLIAPRGLPPEQAVSPAPKSVHETAQERFGRLPTF